MEDADPTGQPFRIPDQPVVADAEGRWSLADQADDPRATVRVGWRTPGYAIDRYAGQHSGQLRREELRNHTAVSRLPEGVTLEGFVAGNDGRPVAHAQVTLGTDGPNGSNPSTRTDAAGRFALTDLLAGPQVVTVTPPDDRRAELAPAMQAVELSASTDPLSFVLPSARRYAFLVTDEQGQPVEGARISASR